MTSATKDDLGPLCPVCGLGVGQYAHSGIRRGEAVEYFRCNYCEYKWPKPLSGEVEEPVYIPERYRK